MLKSNVKYQLLKIVKVGVTQTPVESLDDLDLVDRKGDAITQQWLDKILALMNGELDIGDPTKGTVYTGRSLQHTVTLRQSQMSKNLTEFEDDIPEVQKRELLRATCAIEKDILHEFIMTNVLGTADKKVALFILSSGSGAHNTDARRTAGYLQPIPTALLQPVERVKQLQDHFNLLSKGDHPTYLDFLEKDCALFLGMELIVYGCSFKRS